MAWCVAPKYFPFSISMIYDEYGKGEIWQVREGYDFFSDIDHFLFPIFRWRYDSYWDRRFSKDADCGQILARQEVISCILCYGDGAGYMIL